MLSVAQIVVKIAFSLVIFGGTLGNILVCLVILLNKTMRTPMNYLILNLAISDMVLLVFFSPTFVFREAFTHPTGKAGDLLCIFITGETFAWMAGYTSGAILIAIAIERYYAVAKPLAYGSSFITKRLKFVVAFCWLFAFAWNCVGFKIKFYNEKFDFCDMKWDGRHSFKVYATMSMLVNSVIPSVTMICLYSRAAYILWFKLQNRQLRSANAAREIERQKTKRATKMVLSVSIIYALCWIPESTIFMIMAFAPYLVKGSIAYPASVAMVSLNSAINPLIYSFHSNQFRKKLIELVCCKKARGAIRQVDVQASATEPSTNSSRARDEMKGVGQYSQSSV